MITDRSEFGYRYEQYNSIVIVLLIHYDIYI